MHGSLSPRRPEVVTEASAFRPDFVATDFADTPLLLRQVYMSLTLLAAAALAASRRDGKHRDSARCSMSRAELYRTPTECRRFADDLRGRRHYDASSLNGSVLRL